MSHMSKAVTLVSDLGNRVNNIEELVFRIRRKLHGEPLADVIQPGSIKTGRIHAEVPGFTDQLMISHEDLDRRLSVLRDQLNEIEKAL